MMHLRCLFFHQWTLWRVLAYIGHPTHPRRVERRECVRCDKIQERIIQSGTDGSH